ncbi:MAG TPA: hypothetical protein VGA16_06670 [Candidatus Limnocylindria bacterium]
MRAFPARAVAAVPRGVLAVAAVALAAVAVATAVLPAPPPAASAPVAALSERLGPKTWALAIPVGWLAAPIAGLRADDVLDLVGTRPSERATASDVAKGLRVMSADERTLVVELTAEDASAIASARARGLSLIPIVRSTR